jgi:replicative DNA helicase
MIEPARKPNGRTASPGILPSRAAPHNIEAEQALLGAILINNEARDRVAGFLEAHHFYDSLHQQIYETLSKLIASGKQATPITLKTFFETAEPIDPTLSVPQYLGRLAANAATIINARDYGRTIYDLATRRQLILIGEDIVNAAYDAPVDFPPKEQIEEAETRLFSLAETAENEAPLISAYDAINEAITAADIAYRRGTRLDGLSTGIRSLDAKIGGLSPGDLIVLAGRPSMGKTALATNLAENCVRAGSNTYFSCLEMSAKQQGGRIVASAIGVSAFDLRRGIGLDQHMPALLEEQERWAALPIHFDQSSALTIAQLRARVRRAHRKRRLDLLVIDYLQLLRGTTYRGKNRVEEIGEISGGLKALAKEVNIPVIAVSQLNRAADGREDHRPQLSDLRASGDIEQDADIVMFVYREDYYLERKPPDPGDLNATNDWQRKLAAARGRGEIIVAKHRHGPVGIVEVSVCPKTMRFADLPASGGGS